MSDNLRRYRAIHAALLQGYSGQLTGTLVRHLATLAALISSQASQPATSTVRPRANILPES